MASTYLLSKLNGSADAPNPSSDVVKGVLTAFAALVPAEVIATSSTIAGYLTSTDASGKVSWAHVGSARLLMFVLGIVVIPLIYWVGADKKSAKPFTKPSRTTVALVGISILAYAGWLALQTPTIYDGWFGTDGELSDGGTRAAYLAVAVIVLGVTAGALGYASAKDSPDGTAVAPAAQPPGTGSPPA